MPQGTTANDYLTSQGFNDLTSSLGLRGTGGGWNPALPLLRRASVGQGVLALQQGAFANELEPMRQGLARSFLLNVNPANIQARIDALYRQNRQNAALRQSQDAATAPFMGISPASLAAYNAQADRMTAGSSQMARSPEGLAGAYGQGLGVIQSMQDPAALMALANATQSVQGQTSQRQAGQQQGGMFGQLAGTVGQLYGMGAFGRMGGGGNPLQNAVNRGAITPPDAGNPFYR